MPLARIPLLQIAPRGVAGVSIPLALVSARRPGHSRQSRWRSYRGAICPQVVVERSDLPVDTLAAVFAPPPPTWNLTQRDYGLLDAIAGDLVCVASKTAMPPPRVAICSRKALISSDWSVAAVPGAPTAWTLGKPCLPALYSVRPNQLWTAWSLSQASDVRCTEDPSGAPRHRDRRCHRRRPGESCPGTPCQSR